MAMELAEDSLRQLQLDVEMLFVFRCAAVLLGLFAVLAAVSHSVWHHEHLALLRAWQEARCKQMLSKQGPGQLLYLLRDDPCLGATQHIRVLLQRHQDLLCVPCRPGSSSSPRGPGSSGSPRNGSPRVSLSPQRGCGEQQPQPPQRGSREAHRSSCW